MFSGPLSGSRVILVQPLGNDPCPCMISFFAEMQTISREEVFPQEAFRIQHRTDDIDIVGVGISFAYGLDHSVCQGHFGPEVPPLETGFNGNECKPGVGSLFPD